MIDPDCKEFVFSNVKKEKQSFLQQNSCIIKTWLNTGKRALHTARSRHDCKELPRLRQLFVIIGLNYLAASSMATATATVAPTMGLLPMPIRPIISTCAGTDEEPANCASECMRPMVSVMP